MASLMGHNTVLFRIEEMPQDRVRTDVEDFVIKNEILLAELMMTSEEDICFDLVENYRTEELPDGYSRVAREKLKAKNRPSCTRL
jgi:hypothetical protein